MSRSCGSVASEVQAAEQASPTVFGSAAVPAKPRRARRFGYADAFWATVGRLIERLPKQRTDLTRSRADRQDYRRDLRRLAVCSRQRGAPGRETPIPGSDRYGR